MVSRLCDIQPEALTFEDVHWSLGFTNSSFAGEFSESLVQALYLCPTIRSLTFARDPGFHTPDSTNEEIEGEQFKYVTGRNNDQVDVTVTSFGIKHLAEGIKTEAPFSYYSSSLKDANNRLNIGEIAEHESVVKVKKKEEVQLRNIAAFV